MQEYWSGLSLPSSGDLPDPRIEPESPALQAASLSSELMIKSQQFDIDLSEKHFLTTFVVVHMLNCIRLSDWQHAKHLWPLL